MLFMLPTTYRLDALLNQIWQEEAAALLALKLKPEQKLSLQRTLNQFICKTVKTALKTGLGSVTAANYYLKMAELLLNEVSLTPAQTIALIDQFNAKISSRLDELDLEEAENLLVQRRIAHQAVLLKMGLARYGLSL